MDTLLMNTPFDPTLLDILYYDAPAAYANLTGNAENPTLTGTALFYPAFDGTLVAVEAYNLPVSKENERSFYGMHIHEKGDCTLPFDKTGNHYNPADMPHPLHAGDLPPLLGNQGYAFSVFFTSRFQIEDVLNRSLIIHVSPDDFTSQPSGNSGIKIGCGIILQV